MAEAGWSPADVAELPRADRLRGLVYSSISEQAAERFSGRVEVYRRDVQVHRGFASESRRVVPRGEIKELSAASRRRLALVARNLEPGRVRCLITLTLPGDWLAVVPDGRTLKVKAHRMWQELRRKYPGIGGLWFLEFQKRGAPHYHAGVTVEVDRAWLAATWARIVAATGEERRRHELAGTGSEVIRLADGFTRYVSKYASKWEQKIVPDYFAGVGRMWGLFGSLRVEVERVAGSRSEVADVMRVARRLQRSRSKAAGQKFDDKGWRGWTSYDVGPAISQYLSWRSAQPKLLQKRGVGDQRRKTVGGAVA